MDSVRLRDTIPWLLILLLLAGLGLFAWMSAHPDSPRLRRAERWPVVGEWVTRFRSTWSPPPVPADSGGLELGEAEGHAPGGESAREPTAVQTLPPVWLEPGMELRRAPEPTAPVLGRVGRYREHATLDRRGSWHRVEVEGTRGWVEVDRPPPAPGEPPLGRSPEPPRPVAALSPDPARLARALALLGTPAPLYQLGPYELATDLGDRELLARLDGVASRVEAAYRERTGLVPVGEPAEAVVLFGTELAYRRFQRAEARLQGLPAAGHAGHGMIVLYHGRRPAEQVVATLIHEITHLLNRRAVGPALPPWLDEGLAEDLTWCRVAPDGTPLLGTFGGARVLDESLVFVTGGLAVLGRFTEALEAGRVPPLSELVTLDWEAFVHRDRELHYQQAGLLVRYLLDGRDAEGFRAFLADTARGMPITGERLVTTLGVSWERLETGFITWVGERQEEQAAREKALREALAREREEDG